MSAIEPLGTLDALFLHIETPQMPMHVGSMHLYDVAARRRRGYLERVRRNLSERLHLSPVFTRRLVQVPLRLANPAWTREPAVDIEYHVRGVDLPPPGTLAQFEDCVADLHARLMDRGRPLWEFYVIRGLADGRTGVYCKVHHAAIDGKAGVVLARAMLDLEPDPPPVPAPSRTDDEGEPGAIALLGSALSAQARLSARLLGSLPALLKAGSYAAGDALAGRLRSLAAPPGRRGGRDGLPLFAPRTPLNVSIDARRAVATAQARLADLRAICASLGGTVNDALLAICSGALRRYLDERGALPRESLIAAVPVSLRAAGDEAQNTQATMLRASLATDVADPGERYRAIRASSGSMKDTAAYARALLPTDLPSLGVPWLLPGLASLYERARIAERVEPVVNLVISNVPGPQVPLYMSGARMLTYWPLSIVTQGMALNVTVESYDGTLYFGLVACRRALPDLRRLAACLDEAREELLACARADAHAPAATPAHVPAAGSEGLGAARRPRGATAPGRPRATKPAARPTGR